MSSTFVQASNSIVTIGSSPNQGKYYLNSGNGLTVFSFENGVEERFDFTEIYKKQYGTEINKDGIWNNPQTYEILIFENVWLLNTGMGLIRYYPKQRKADFSLLWPHQLSLIGHNSPYGTYIIRHLPSNFGTPEQIIDDAIYRYDSEKDQLIRMIDLPDVFKSTNDNVRPKTITTVKNGLVFFDFSNHKFLIYNPTTNDTVFYSVKAPYNNFPDTMVRALTTTSEGDLWLRGANGVYLFDPVTGKYENYHEQIGLKENERIQLGVTDANDVLWLGVNRHLLRFDPSTGEVNQFDKKHGLDAGGFVQGFIPHQSNDTLVLPANYGLLYFEPSKILTKKYSYDIAISRITINRDTISQLMLDSFLLNPPNLKWDENFISIEVFSNQIYSVGQKNYSYRLLGQDTNWVDNGNQNVIHFNNLNPGEFVFEVYCTNSYGERTAVLRFPFTISKPFWLKWWFILFEIILVGLLIFAFVKYRERHLRKIQEKLEYTVTERTQEVREKMSEIETQKEIIEEKNKELTDSIKYAKRIQNTLLASQELLEKNLPNHFMFFKPKDIVSGDFYWALEREKYFYLAVCDSTGHGVPGAFMSLLNIRFLNEAIVEANLQEPGKILDYVREKLIVNLASEGAKDGMDGTLIRFDKVNHKITYASAHNSPVIIRNGEPQELSADKMPIGHSEIIKSFQTHTINTEPGDVIYFFTDGYPDQFGGDKGKKLKYKNFIQILQNYHTLELNDQLNKLDEFLTRWKGNLEQIDDVLVCGILIKEQ